MSAETEAKTISYTRVVDLSHSISPGIPLWPGDPPVVFDEDASIEKDGYYLRRFSLGEHSGTHLNAPRSFYTEGQGVDAYPASSLVLPAVVIDVSEGATANPDYALAVEEVAIWERRYGPVPSGSMVLLHTGWQSRWDRPQDYFGLDSQGRMHFPGFGLEAARLLLGERGVAGLGTDAPGVEPGADGGFTVNRLVLGQSRLVLECLTNLDRLPPTGATLVIGVLKLKDGGGSPASVLALIP